MEDNKTIIEWGFSSEEIASKCTTTKSPLALSALFGALAIISNNNSTFRTTRLASTIEKAISTYSAVEKNDDAYLVCLNGSAAYGNMLHNEPQIESPEMFWESRTTFSNNLDIWNAAPLVTMHYFSCESRTNLITREDFKLFMKVAEGKEFSNNARKGAIAAISGLALYRTDLVIEDDRNSMDRITACNLDPDIIQEAMETSEILSDILSNPGEPLQKFILPLEQKKPVSTDELTLALETSSSPLAQARIFKGIEENILNDSFVPTERLANEIRKKVISCADKRLPSDIIADLIVNGCDTLTLIDQNYRDFTTHAWLDDFRNAYVMIRNNDVRENFVLTYTNFAANHIELLTPEDMTFLMNNGRNMYFTPDTRINILGTIGKAFSFRSDLIRDDLLNDLNELSLSESEPFLAMSSKIAFRTGMDSQKYPNEPIRHITWALVKKIPDEELPFINPVNDCTLG